MNDNMIYTSTHTYHLDLLNNANIGINLHECNNDNLLNFKVKDYNYNNELYKFVKYDKSKLNNDNINTYGLCRSIVFKNDKIVCVSPPKSYSYDLFVSLYDNKECAAEEYVEGTMINLFYDSNKEEWEISTKSTIGGKVAYFNNEKHLNFREMFLETCNDCNFEFDILDKNLTYTFVLQHPNNRIVIPFIEKRLYLVACYKINNDNLTYDAIDTNSVKYLFNDINIHYPKQYKFNSYSELIDINNNLDMYSCVGIMIHHPSSGSRSKLRNTKYEHIRKLRGNQPKLQYRYLELRISNNISEYLCYYPEHTNYFKSYEQEIIVYMSMLYDYYVSCYIYKQNVLKNYPYEYKQNMYILHEKYKTILKNKQQKITKKYVIDYVNSLHPSQLMFVINYKKR
tara:strand:- start:131 stop:1321 length:1191 start_codon:yes stop_codon:yes gene_type:complete